MLKSKQWSKSTPQTKHSVDGLEYEITGHVKDALKDTNRRQMPSTARTSRGAGKKTPALNRSTPPVYATGVINTSLATPLSTMSGRLNGLDKP